MPAVNSSAIASIDYNSESREMYVSFHETGNYTYYDVPEEVYLEFLHAKSVGQYFNIYIKDRYAGWCDIFLDKLTARHPW